MSFASATSAPPTLTLKEQKILLDKTGKTKGAEREHMLYSLALGSALREHELAGLNVGDIVFRAGLGGLTGVVKSKIHLTVFKGANVKPRRELATARPRKPIRQVVFLPRAVRRKFEYFINWKRKNGESVKLDAPLFVTSKASASSSAGDRLSTRSMRHHFRQWQKRCGFETLHGLHVLRHTALSNLYRATKSIRATQLQARHRNINTTQIYTHMSEEEILRAVEGLPC